MSLRQQLQQRSAAVAGLLRDGGLLKAIRAELTDELSRSDSTHYKPQVGLSVAGFTVEWDDPRAQDVVLRRTRPGEEVAVSGVLAPLRFRGEEALPRGAAVKVCVKRSDEPVLRFDCRVSPGEGAAGCDLTVRRATWYPRVVDWKEVKYNAPKFSSLDPELQGALKQYLTDRGISRELNDFVLTHLRTKEQAQYVNWLQSLEITVAKVA